MVINLFYFLLIFITVNIRAFYLMFQDKKTAMANNGISGEGRISEASLFLNALLMGFVGIGLAMLVLKHKTRKSYFGYGIPLIAIYNALLLFLLMEKLTEDYGWQFIFNLP